MKKLLTIILILCAVAAQAQVLTFTGRDRTGQDYVRLDRVSIFNQTQLWHEVLYYPDTTLQMGFVGIEEQAENGFQLMQNVPNPFDGVTDFALSLPTGEDVSMEIFDVNGKKVASQQFGSLAPGTHIFRATLCAPQTYLLSASTHNGKTSIKMINTGDGGDNSIIYLGMANADGGLSIQLKKGRGTTPYPFNYGDRMKYTGYATIDGTERVSEVIEQYQAANNMNLSLRFDVARPEVTTITCGNIFASSATMNGEVTADNNALVTERGFCYRAGSTAPTLADNTIVAGSGLGTYSALATDLQPGTNYRVRAYAQNAVGVAYGQSLSFTTADTLPVVTTTQPSNIAATSFDCGGNVMAANCLGTLYRGICWNITGQPTTTDDHLACGMGGGVFTTSITGLEPATTYYVRAYATNNAGTAYGEEFSVTTLCDLPMVNTVDITDIASRTATGNGEVTNEHGAAVTARGICWNTMGMPTTTDAHTTNGTGMGDFSGLMDSLTPATTYYVRAYATNAIGTAYGAQLSFTTLCDVPELATTPASNIAATSFATGGNILAANCTDDVSRGVCWNTTGQPTIADNHTNDGTGVGTFTSSVTGLDCNTAYYVRAYATNSMGTAYGDEIVVTTLEPSIPEVTTQAATIYNCLGFVATAEVLNENCAAVTARGFCYSTSPNPPLSDAHTTNGTGLGNYEDTIVALEMGTTYYVRAYATNNEGTAYGEELTVTTCDIPTLTTANVTSISDNSATCGGNVTSDGGATVTARGVCWSTSQNPTLSDNHTANGSGAGNFTSSITGLSAVTTYYVRAYATNSMGTAYGEEKQFTTMASLPTVTTSAVSNISQNSATCGGNVTSDGGATVTARGVCWSTSQNPTVSGSHTANGTGTGNFTSSITGLTAGTTYYVRAYATNSTGTAYGAQKSFVSNIDCPSTLTDIDGNTYNTVIIGNQCWMKENLKTTKYADGTSIDQGSSTSYDVAYWYYPNNSASNKTTYGLLYNWKAVMRNASSSSSNPSNVLGICPTGWHVPSDAEWTQLTDYVGSQSQYRCSSNTTYIAKALASTTGWGSSTNTCAVGNTPSSNNATGFGAMPAGGYYGYYSDFGDYANFWSATELDSGRAYARSLRYNSAYVTRSNGYKNSGLSVRCLRD